MATISRLKPGQIVYDRTRVGVGNTTMRRDAIYPVRIVEVDPEGAFVIASRNGNPAKKFYERSVKTWFVNEPKPRS